MKQIRHQTIMELTMPSREHFIICLGENKSRCCIINDHFKGQKERGTMILMPWAWVLMCASDLNKLER